MIALDVEGLVLATLLSYEDNGRTWLSASTLVHETQGKLAEVLMAITKLEQAGLVEPNFRDHSIMVGLRLTTHGRMEALRRDGRGDYTVDLD